LPSLSDQLFDKHAIVAHLRDGRVIAWSQRGAPATFGDDGEYDSWLQRVPDLKYIEYVLDVEFDWGIPTSNKLDTSDGITYKMMIYGEAGKSLHGNVVGMTLLGRATNLSGGTLQAKSFGTSVYVDVIAIGPA
jgi:hypothetical protein